MKCHGTGEEQMFLSSNEGQGDLISYREFNINRWEDAEIDHEHLGNNADITRWDF